MSLSQQEFDYKWHSAFNCWIVNSNTFAVYFQKQWVEGLFIEGKVLSSGAGCTSTNNCIESFNAMLMRCFMEHKQHKVGKCSVFS
jgi:hypothetical protein